MNRFDDDDDDTLGAIRGCLVAIPLCVAFWSLAILLLTTPIWIPALIQFWH